ncbi:fluoride efflux transporter CrcB [Amaricoccus sp.]|uniref:fluoride efflux transporter CrcB n=1 Tax=Amaricoccus sp. TaxID=1872485 RepID=UPI001B49270F|nr:fluoride efflux transporter CrcB [Amaricoccus sp.]MBP7001156.1 fluoride efflux transporter CrcB [Amaricoccus sp.]
MAVALGSALGSLARWEGAGALQAALGPPFPSGTLAVNVAGSFLIGLIAALTSPGGRFPASPAVRLFLMAGFCGGFTTFSTFALDTLQLAQRGAAPVALLYVALSVPLWLAAVLTGWRLGRRLDRA